MSSYSFNNLIPLYKAVKISASDIQNLALGEISTVPSLPMGVCSPPIPLTDKPKGLQIYLALASVPSLVKLGNLMCTEALIPVPMLVGQLVTTPKSSCLAQPPSINFSTISIATLNLSNTRFKIVPVYIAITLKWSSSPTQIMNPPSAEI